MNGPVTDAATRYYTFWGVTNTAWTLIGVGALIALVWIALELHAIRAILQQSK